MIDVVQETSSATSLVLAAPDWPGHRAGQHVEIRSAGRDVTRPARPYCLASAPEEQHLMLTVAPIALGEVSPWLCHHVRVGDDLELRGPFGDDFSWEASEVRPLQLIGGGAGIVPLRAMLRHWVAQATPVPTGLLYCAPSVMDLVYAAEIPSWRQTGVGVAVTLTGTAPTGWTGLCGRVDREMISTSTMNAGLDPTVYVSGPTDFVDAVDALLLAAGHSRAAVHSRRFGLPPSTW